MKALVYNINVPRFVLLKAAGSVLKNLYYKGPFATVKLKDVAEPRLPSEEWVKIKTAVCGFCGSDQSLIFLRDSPTASPFTSFPCIFGHEVAGEVTEIGELVKDFKPGDRVAVAPHLDCRTRGIKEACDACSQGMYGSCENVARGDLSPGMFTGICSDIGGGFAPYLVAHKSQLFKLPDSFSWEQGALLEPLAVALQSVWDNRPEDKDEVLVIGGGVIGTMVVKALRGLEIGCRISVSEPSSFHAEAIRETGADHIISDGDLLGAASALDKSARYKPLMGDDIMMGGYDRIFD
ncbi:MAG: alcohol dehydrogenase catalytic domain-containing protein, partial [Bacteroidales bacterium]|nr:alcohol dehydrogenase catalytic domain-containing protein [Bacteroidales bacterium]